MKSSSAVSYEIHKKCYDEFNASKLKRHLSAKKRKKFNNSINTRSKCPTNLKFAEFCRYCKRPGHEDPWHPDRSWSLHAASIVTRNFFTEHQNVNKPKSKAVRTVSYLFTRLLSVFFFFMSRCKQKKITLFYNRLQFVKETQTDTV